MNELSTLIKDIICYFIDSIFKFLDSIEQVFIEMSNRIELHPQETIGLILWGIALFIIEIILIGKVKALRYYSDSSILKLFIVLLLGIVGIGLYSVYKLYFQIFL